MKHKNINKSNLDSFLDKLLRKLICSLFLRCRRGF